MFPHHSDQMSQRSQVSRVTLCMSISKVLSEWVSESVIQWQGHLLSCSGQLKININFPRATIPCQKTESHSVCPPKTFLQCFWPHWSSFANVFVMLANDDPPFTWTSYSPPPPGRPAPVQLYFSKMFPDLSSDLQVNNSITHPKLNWIDLRTLLRKLFAIVFAMFLPTVELVFSRETTWKCDIDVEKKMNKLVLTVIATNGGQTFGKSHCCLIRYFWPIHIEKVTVFRCSSISCTGHHLHHHNLLCTVEDGGPPGWVRVSLSLTISSTTRERSKEGGTQSE